MKKIIRVRDVMTFMPDTILGSLSISEGMRMLRVNGYRHLPVTLQGKPIGIVSDRDLKWALSVGLSETTPIMDIMNEDPYCVQSSQLLADIIPQLLERKFGSALVVDPSERIVGILTSHDLVRTLGNLLAVENDGA